MRILIGIPTPEQIHYKFADSLNAVLLYTASKYGCQIGTYWINGVRTDKNRNTIVKHFLENDFDYLLFLDSDMVYPEDILEKYIESGKDLIGGIYYKRYAPHYPIVYGRENNKFVTLDLPIDGTVKEVGGIGTGGMFIKRNVFEQIEKTGNDYWFVYGDKYHLPNKEGDQATHDLVFCRKALNAGVKVHIHTGVLMNHISTIEVTSQHWEETKPVKEEDHVTIIVPAYGADSINKLYRTLESIERNTDYPAYEVKVVVDGDPEFGALLKNNDRKFRNTRFLYRITNSGYANVVNEEVDELNGYFVYLAQDVEVSEGWLSTAMAGYKEAFPENDGLVAFNDGRWEGEIACHGLCHKNFLKYTGSTLFFPGYKHYHCDLELSQVAIANQKLAYAHNVAVNHMQAKSGKSAPDKSLAKGLLTADEDTKTYNERKAQNFPKH